MKSCKWESKVRKEDVHLAGGGEFNLGPPNVLTTMLHPIDQTVSKGSINDLAIASKLENEIGCHLRLQLDVI